MFSIFEKNHAEIRLVGGCIRDALMNTEIKDIDTATTIEPNDVLNLLESNNIEYDDYAIQYGSIIDRNTAEYKNSKGDVICKFEVINFNDLPKLNDSGKLF